MTGSTACSRIMEPIQHDAAVSVVAARLEADLVEAEARVADLDASIEAVVRATDGANSDDEHDPEGATIAFERAQSQALKSVTETHLAQIHGALARLAAGTYGVCVVCGSEI